jgi:hypothetical protein
MSSVSYRGARFFFVNYTKTEINIPNFHEICQKATHYTKRPHTIPKGHTLYQKATHYTKRPHTIPKGHTLYQKATHYTKNGPNNHVGNIPTFFIPRLYKLGFFV